MNATISRSRPPVSTVWPPSTRRLKVLQIGKFYFPHRGGMETHLSDLCAGLRPHVDLELIVANDGRSTVNEEIDGMHAMRMGQWLNLAGASICPGMVRRIRESRAELVHIHLPNPTAMMAYLASGHQGRLVFTYHSDIVRQKVLGPAFQPILHRALNRGAAIIATSEAYMETSPVLAQYRDRCRIIPFGIEVKEYEHAEAAAVSEIRQKYAGPIVLSVGRLVYYKGLQYLIQAMRSIRAHLLIAGEGPLRSELERLAREIGVAEKVHFLGRVEDAVPYYHAADVFVLPSIARSEAFGLVQLEAMACGTPVVNTQLPSGVPFVSMHGETGLTVPPEDAPVLADTIQTLLDSPELRLLYGRQARRRVLNEFGKAMMIDRTLHLYHDVMNTTQASALTA